MRPSSLPADDTLDATVHYLVDTAERPVGVVEGWERDGHGRPKALVVAQGWFGRRQVVIPVRHLAAIDHGSRRVAVTAGAAPLERRGLFQRLLDRPSPHEDGGPAGGLAGPIRGRPVLCGVAADDHAPRVVAVAATLAEQLDSRLVVVHVTPETIPPGVSAAPWGQARLREAEQEDGEQLLDSLLAGVVAGAPAGVGRVVMPGRPAETLEQLALREGARLLVVGCSGRGALSSAACGSVSRRLAGHAPCPVVVVPPGVEPTAPWEAREAVALGAVQRGWPADTR